MKDTKVYINNPALDEHIHLQAGEHQKLVVVNFEPGEHTIQVDIEGADAEVEIDALMMAGSLRTEVRHLVGGSSSRQLLRFILPAEQQGHFEGHLYIAPDAQHTDAQQTNRNLLLAPSATMRTLPQLEIYADDVKASHGASTGQLDTSALFYMQQRGIDPQTAKKLLVGAFASDVLEQIEDEELRNSVAAQLEDILQRTAID